MKLTITTPVKANYLDIKENFNEQLFIKLSPPFPPVRLLRFDGCQKGDIVSLELNFIFFRQAWTSVITMDNTDKGTFEFVDEGKQLPFFLSSWRHHHKIKRVSDEESEIIDDIEFTSPAKLLDYLLFPSLWLQFSYRKPIYRKVLGSR